MKTHSWSSKLQLSPSIQKLLTSSHSDLKAKLKFYIASKYYNKKYVVTFVSWTRHSQGGRDPTDYKSYYIFFIIVFTCYVEFELCFQVQVVTFVVTSIKHYFHISCLHISMKTCGWSSKLQLSPLIQTLLMSLYLDLKAR